MGNHSSILAGKIPWTEEPGGLQSVGSQKSGHVWVTSVYMHDGIRTEKLWKWHQGIRCRKKQDAEDISGLWWFQMHSIVEIKRARHSFQLGFELFFMGRSPCSNSEGDTLMTVLLVKHLLAPVNTGQIRNVPPHKRTCLFCMHFQVPGGNRMLVIVN